MKKTRRAALLAGILLIAVAAAGLVREYQIRRQSERIYEELASTVAETETEEETETPEETQPPYVSPIDFESLWAVNEDVVGWLQVPGTVIDYPILHDPESNETYLHKDIEGNESAAGAIYLDCDNEGDFSDYHNVIYGHHMRNGTMFKDVMKFRDQSFLETHDRVLIYLPDREIHLKPYACLYTSPDGIRRMTAFESAQQLQEYAAEMTKDASTWVEPEGEIGRLVSLITCSYEFSDARTILYCYEETE